MEALAKMFFVRKVAPNHSILVPFWIKNVNKSEKGKSFSQKMKEKRWWSNNVFQLLIWWFIDSPVGPLEQGPGTLKCFALYRTKHCKQLHNTINWVWPLAQHMFWKKSVKMNTITTYQNVNFQAVAISSTRGQIGNTCAKHYVILKDSRLNYLVLRDEL